MNSFEFRQAMREIGDRSSGDPEGAHGEADRLLVSFLHRLARDMDGDDRRNVVTALGYFDTMDKWYA